MSRGHPPRHPVVRRHALRPSGQRRRRQLVNGEKSMDNGNGLARTILIAERDRNVRDLERHFLETVGFSVEFADDGVAALSRARLALPQLVITEILIPKL